MHGQYNWHGLCDCMVSMANMIGMVDRIDELDDKTIKGPNQVVQISFTKTIKVNLTFT